MAENKMKEVAKLLGVEIDESFIITREGKIISYNPYVLRSDGLYDKDSDFKSYLLVNLLNGTCEIEKPILNDVEKHYLENVLRPFKNRVMYVKKVASLGYECIRYRVHLPIKKYGNTTCELPYFDKGTMYKGMKPEEQYSLEELRLFMGDDE